MHECILGLPSSDFVYGVCYTLWTVEGFPGCSGGRVIIKLKVTRVVIHGSNLSAVRVPTGSGHATTLLILYVDYSPLQ